MGERLMRVWIIIAHLIIADPDEPGSDVWMITGLTYAFKSEKACQTNLVYFQNSQVKFECKPLRVFRK